MPAYLDEQIINISNIVFYTPLNKEALVRFTCQLCWRVLFFKQEVAITRHVLSGEEESFTFDWIHCKLMLRMKLLVKLNLTEGFKSGSCETLLTWAKSHSLAAWGSQWQTTNSWGDWSDFPGGPDWGCTGEGSAIRRV